MTQVKIFMDLVIKNDNIGYYTKIGKNRKRRHTLFARAAVSLHSRAKHIVVNGCRRSVAVSGMHYSRFSQSYARKGECIKYE